MNKVSRRKFLTSVSLLTAVFPLHGIASDLIQDKRRGFSFMLLGDLHFDRLTDHDNRYLKEKYPHDIRQIENYSQITRDNLTSLMRVSKQWADKIDAKFYLQLGDFVEGLCGSKELATKQATELISFVRDQNLQRPFIAIKGNHDVTGEGAKEMFMETVLPWQSREMKQSLTSANNVYVHNNARFILFDDYVSKTESLEWLKTVIKDHRKGEILFFCTHEPVVPYNARANWIIYGHPGEEEQREELLNLLGEHQAIVLSGHLHKTGLIVRNTPSGNFVQVGLGSVMYSLDAPIKDHLKGIESYNTNLLDLEPTFSPASLEERKALIQHEKPHIRYFEYADFCGFGTVKISNDHEVTLSIFAHANQDPWITVNLSDLVKA